MIAPRQVSPGEIQNERSDHNRHFNDEQFIVGADQLWNVKPPNLDDVQFFEPLIDGAFMVVGLRPSMSFHCGSAARRLVFSGIDDTVNSEAEPLRKS